MNELQTAQSAGTTAIHIDLAAFAAKEGKTVRTKDQMTLDYALHQWHNFKNSLERGVSVLLPDDNGYADTRPAVNLLTGAAYKGSGQIYLKQKAKNQGFPTAEFLTFEQAQEAARAAGKKIFLKEGQQGIAIDRTVTNPETNKPEVKREYVFNIAQFANPKTLRRCVSKAQEKARVIDIEKTRVIETQSPPSQIKKTFAQKIVQKLYDRVNAGGPVPLKAEKANPADAEIVCSSTDPKKYIGQYLAAVRSGVAFKVQPVQAKEFSKKIIEKLNERGPGGKMDPFALLKIMKTAQGYADEFLAARSGSLVLEKSVRQTNPRPEIVRKREELSMTR